MKYFNFILISALFFGLSFQAYSTHNKAGEITYRKLNGFTYEITITTYTDPQSTAADRCELGIFFGDGNSDTIPRINHPTPCNSTISCNCNGEIIVSGKIKKNVYRTTHTYPGPAEYIITVEDPNRVDLVQNIPKSVSIPFALRSTLIINPLVGSNSSPVLTFPPVDDACICNPFYHNPGAVDPDGDSLSYSLSVCYGLNGDPIPGYTFPPALCPSNTFEIDAKTGTLTWDGPGVQGIYNACILITEYRKNSRGQWLRIGDVLRDMQINVTVCDNAPPQFLENEDICVEAGTTISETVIAVDSIFQNVSLTGTGEPLFLTNSPARFNSARSNGQVSSSFDWNTQCVHIRNSWYQMNFKAEDDGSPVSLVNFHNFQIRVIGPAPKNVRSSTGKNAITVSWNASGCENAVGYDIYRKIDSTNWSPDSCTIGIPANLKFTKIGSTSGYNSTSFSDNNKGIGLYHGLVYCYRVVAIYPGETPGYSSEETCNELPFDVPIINRNSVALTSETGGIDSVSWAKPQEINLNQYAGPYYFNVYRSPEINSANDLIFTSEKEANYFELDTLLRYGDLNTKSSIQTYLIELFSDDSLIGTTHTASSPFLTVASDDKRLHLTLDLQVPWDNFLFEIYREDASSNFVLIDTTDEPNYTDTGLVNEREYTYQVRTIGRYSIEELPDTIYNFSQIASGIPKDTIPPCPPDKPNIDSKCELFQNELTWNNVNNTCQYKDAIGYNIYRSEFVGSEYKLVGSTTSPSDTTIFFDELLSVAGCYAVTAIDSFENESQFSPRVCVDNCPLYELPNVFSPGGDGINDVFHPIYPWRYVQDVDMTIFNRWGQIVFETDNPEILWNGINQLTSETCPSGVYFYVCVVNEIRLSGIIPREIKGSITLLNQPDYQKPKNAE